MKEDEDDEENEQDEEDEEDADDNDIDDDYDDHEWESGPPILLKQWNLHLGRPSFRDNAFSNASKAGETAGGSFKREKQYAKTKICLY